MRVHSGRFRIIPITSDISSCTISCNATTNNHINREGIPAQLQYENSSQRIDHTGATSPTNPSHQSWPSTCRPVRQVYWDKQPHPRSSAGGSQRWLNKSHGVTLPTPPLVGLLARVVPSPVTDSQAGQTRSTVCLATQCKAPHRAGPVDAAPV